MSSLFPAHPPAPPSSIAPQLRQAMRGVAATVTLVSTATPAGDRHAMIASSFTSVTLEPPTVLVCIGRHTSIHTPLLAVRRFCINILRTEHIALARACSGGTHGADRFAAHNQWRYTEDGLPWLEDAQASLICELEQQHEVGTHSVLLARVTGIHVRAAGYRPLIYLDGRFTCATDEAQIQA